MRHYEENLKKMGVAQGATGCSGLIGGKTRAHGRVTCAVLQGLLYFSVVIPLNSNNF